MNPDIVIQRLKEFVRHFGIKGIIFLDSNFFVDKDRSRYILRQAVKENIIVSRFTIDAQTFMSLNDNDLLLLQQVGARHLPIAIESGAERIQALIHKTIPIFKLLEFNRKLKRFDIRPNYLFMMGFPGELKEELAETVSLALRLIKENPRSISSFSVYTPYPATELFQLIVNQGFTPPVRLEDWSVFERQGYYEISGLLSTEMKNIIEMISICSFFIGDIGTRESSGIIHPLVKRLKVLYEPVARWRMKRLFYHFPIEIKAAKLLRRYKTPS
jgi:radical SAM superfamily enzyme YgiQ (UPF0313 family)